MKTLISATAAAALLLAPVADAQNLFGQFQNAMKSQSNNTPAASVVNAAGFFGLFQAARLEMNRAQLELAIAFELKDQITLLQTEQTRLQGGAPGTPTASRKATALSENVDAAVQDRIQQKAVLSAEGKKHFQAAIPHLLIGTLLTIKLSGQMKEALTSSSLSDKVPLLMIAKDLPRFVNSTVSNYKMVLGYGKDQQYRHAVQRDGCVGHFVRRT